MQCRQALMLTSDFRVMLTDSDYGVMLTSSFGEDEMAPVERMENRLGERGRVGSKSTLSSSSFDLELFSNDLLCFSFSLFDPLELSDLDFDPSLFSLFDLELNFELDLDSFSFEEETFFELLLLPLLSLRSPDDLELELCLRLEDDESLDLECFSRSPE